MAVLGLSENGAIVINNWGDQCHLTKRQICSVPAIARLYDQFICSGKGDTCNEINSDDNTATNDPADVIDREQVTYMEADEYGSHQCDEEKSSDYNSDSAAAGPVHALQLDCHSLSVAAAATVTAAKPMHPAATATVETASATSVSSAISSTPISNKTRAASVRPISSYFTPITTHQYESQNDSDVETLQVVTASSASSSSNRKRHADASLITAHFFPVSFTSMATDPCTPARSQSPICCTTESAPDEGNGQQLVRESVDAVRKERVRAVDRSDHMYDVIDDESGREAEELQLAIDLSGDETITYRSSSSSSSSYSALPTSDYAPSSPSSPTSSASEEANITLEKTWCRGRASLAAFAKAVQAGPALLIDFDITAYFAADGIVDTVSRQPVLYCWQLHVRKAAAWREHIDHRREAPDFPVWAVSCFRRHSKWLRLHPGGGFLHYFGQTTNMARRYRDAAGTHANTFLHHVARKYSHSHSTGVPAIAFSFGVLACGAASTPLRVAVAHALSLEKQVSVLLGLTHSSLSFASGHVLNTAPLGMVCGTASLLLPSSSCWHSGITSQPQLLEELAVEYYMAPLTVESLRQRLQAHVGAEVEFSDIMMKHFIAERLKADCRASGARTFARSAICSTAWPRRHDGHSGDAGMG